MLHDRLKIANIRHSQEEKTITFTRHSIKKAALMAALDITLKRMHQSPQRCARNIIELGNNAFPNKLSEEDKTVLLQAILEACKQQDAVLVKELFHKSFLL